MGNEGTTSLVLIAWPRIFLGDDHECGSGGCDWAKKCLLVCLEVLLWVVVMAVVTNR